MRKRGTENHIREKWQAYETKTNREIGKIARRFYIVFQMNKAREISNFQEYQTKFRELTQRRFHSE